MRATGSLEEHAVAAMFVDQASRYHTSILCVRFLASTQVFILEAHRGGIVNTLADIIVLVVPLQLLLVLQDRWLRSRLMMIFSTCMITTVASLIHAGFILSSDGPPIVIAALVEVGATCDYV